MVIRHDWLFYWGGKGGGVSDLEIGWIEVL